MNGQCWLLHQQLLLGIRHAELQCIFPVTVLSFSPFWTTWTNPPPHPENPRQTPDNTSHLCFTPPLNYCSVRFRYLGSRTRSIIHQISCLTACSCKSAIAQRWLRSMNHAGIIFSKNSSWHYNAVQVRQVSIFVLLCFRCGWALHCSYIVQYLFLVLIWGALDILCLLKP